MAKSDPRRDDTIMSRRPRFHFLKKAIAPSLIDTNLIIGTAVFGIYFISGFSSVSLAGFFLINVYRINLWLGLFNMIPIPPIDGSKVFMWDIKIFVIVLVIAIALNVLSGTFL